MKLQNLIHIVIGIVCIGLLPGAQAVVPSPDGGYAERHTAVVPSNIDVSGQNRVPSASPFAVGAATHETWADSQAALQFPNASEIAAEIETVSSAPPTRSSFMANWDKVTGATGYLLDVSTSSFVQRLRGRVSRLGRGQRDRASRHRTESGYTYYYRVRPYTATGPGSYSRSNDGYDGAYHRADHSRDVRQLHYREPKRGGDRGDD